MAASEWDMSQVSEMSRFSPKASRMTLSVMSDAVQDDIAVDKFEVKHQEPLPI